MDIRRLLPYITGLIILAFALGSLSHGTPGGSLLFQAYWLLYVIYLAPIAILGIMVALIILIALNWRTIGNGIGFGLANRTRRRKKGSRYSIILYAAFWGLAIFVLMSKKGTIFNPANIRNSTIAKIVNDGTPPPNPFQGGAVFPTLSSLVQNSWFGIAFAGLIVVAGLVVFQSARVWMKESRENLYPELEHAQLEGLRAVHEAIKLVNNKADDPRSRIMASYQHMIATVSRIGAPVSPDQTARELETAMRSAFALKGLATSDLTRLFEEARYSLHEILDSDAEDARKDLEAIADELKVQLKD